MMEPFGGPDAVELPTQAFEVVLSEAVAVTCRLRRVVHGPVGLDGEYVAPGARSGCLAAKSIQNPEHPDLAFKV